MRSTQLHFLWEDSRAVHHFRSGVSLHSHTMHSHEDILFLTQYAHRVPLLAQAVRRHERAYYRQWGRELDYSRVYWTPPLPPSEAYGLERRQIEQLNLEAHVSLTDHDEIEACLQLQVLDSTRQVPVSLEWTVPFGISFIHLGVHNLPSQHVRPLVAAMRQYTKRPATGLLQDLLAALNGHREVLVVFNHPLWDERGIGAAAHLSLVRNFLRDYGHYVHALELNGLRSWAENRAVIQVAHSINCPLVSGGDRHGCEPNANLNLTQASTFAEFVEELRFQRVSEILFMPQYKEDRRLRYMETIWDILRNYPEHVNRIRWSDRVFYRPQNGNEAPISTFWERGDPEVLQWFVAVIRFLQRPGVRSVLRLALSERREFAR